MAKKRHQQMHVETTGPQKQTQQGSKPHQQMTVGNEKNAPQEPMPLPGNPTPCHGDGTPK
jgi:hypothetical protein